MKVLHLQIVADKLVLGNIFILKEKVFNLKREGCIKKQLVCQCKKGFTEDSNACLKKEHILIVSKPNDSGQNFTQSINRESKGDFGHLDIHIANSDGKICESVIFTKSLTGPCFAEFYKTLVYSSNYSYNVMDNFFRAKPLKNNSDFCCVVINIVSFEYGVIDYKWGEILGNMCLERRELDIAMSWLSTLGGAFSALGEQQDHFAQLARRTSIEQFNLARRLGDDFIVSRCRLYFALSLIQMGYLAQARKIIKQQYVFANSSTVIDTRLVNMCRGIWAKLKFEYKKRADNKNHRLPN